MDFAQTLIDWHLRHGRHDLPWQHHKTPYRVWVSEIMLQQTQVATVVGYYERFVHRFPDVETLAAAPIDEVLHLWAGLGYYSRARNLHRASQIIVQAHRGEFPGEVEVLAELPGIGRSTAAAVVSIAFDRRATILDGNVKRVLARYFAIEGAPNERRVEQELWQRADGCTPDSQVAIYTQAIMDFGATLCTRHDPLCMHCPLRKGCKAFAAGRVSDLPTPRKRPNRPTRQVVMLFAVNGRGAVLLQRRPARGIWGGLWSPPEFDSAEAATRFCKSELRSEPSHTECMSLVRHAFTHFDLEITPLRVSLAGPPLETAGEGALWYNARNPERIGLPAPIATLLAGMELQ
ncbi:MAG TPA: A/G-specific adenine glycosylase [Steroidobacteraceae bacterium]|jgi:A/G-specific adenine glycosylase|nr:A/G-specific adenine glycosylase [Steroidobacteraceae bacterium]